MHEQQDDDNRVPAWQAKIWMIVVIGFGLCIFSSSGMHAICCTLNLACYWKVLK